LRKAGTGRKGSGGEKIRRGGEMGKGTEGMNKFDASARIMLFVLTIAYKAGII
jgi:hypothetical protein